MPRVTGGMLARMRSLVRGALGFAKNPGELDDQLGCGAYWAVLAVIAVIILAGLFLTGVIDYDFTLTPAEREATGGAASSAGGSAAPVGEGSAPSAGADSTPVEEPGEPYMDGRHYAIIAAGDAGSRRMYTFELLGEGTSGAIRVWEDETGTGTYTITGDAIVIEMQRMVPPEAHEIWEPSVYEGTMAPDGSQFTGTLRVQQWMGVPGEMALTGEWVETAFTAERL